MMKITTRKSGDVTILDLEGKLTIGVGDYPLRDAVRTALSDGVRKILLHLEKVTMVDSTGVGELVSSYTSASHRGSKVKLLKPSSKLQEILHITQLITLFEIFEDEAEAVKSFS